MTSVSDRLRPVPDALSTEAQVIATVEAVVQGVSSHAGQDLVANLANAGLLAISIPAEFGGADISNVAVAEAVGRLSSWSAEAGARLIDHFTALELLRNAGTTEQRRAIYNRVDAGRSICGGL